MRFSSDNEIRFLTFSFTYRLFYKMLVRSCVFNEVKYDWKVLFCVALLDGCKLSRSPLTILCIIPD